MDLCDARKGAHCQRQVLWLGGSPCSGKSSVARALATRYPLVPYHCDEHWQAHGERATPLAQPCLSRVLDMSWDEIWMRDGATLLADELAIYAEEFPMILHDLDQQAQRAQTIIAEGAALLPTLVAPRIADPRRAIWLVPTEAFQRRVYPGRGAWVQQILAQCSDAETALDNWMARDIAFARHVAAQAEGLGLRVLWVDGALSLEENTRLVADWFAPHLPPKNALR